MLAELWNGGDGGHDFRRRYDLQGFFFFLNLSKFLVGFELVLRCVISVEVFFIVLVYFYFYLLLLCLYNCRWWMIYDFI